MRRVKSSGATMMATLAIYFLLTVLSTSVIITGASEPGSRPVQFPGALLGLEGKIVNKVLD